MTDIPTLTHHTHCMDKRLVKVEEDTATLIVLKNSIKSLLEANHLLQERLKVFDNIETRFREIETFMKHMLNFFNPTPKMKRELERLGKQLKAKDDELHNIKQGLKGILE